MSKLYSKYEELKKKDSNKVYLLKSGIFYVALNEDAKRLSELFGFKITNLNDVVVKCGFPETRIDYYSKLLTSCSVDFEIIESIQTNSQSNANLSNNSQIKKLIKSIGNLDMNTISFEKAFKLLNKYNQEAKEIINNR